MTWVYNYPEWLTFAMGIVVMGLVAALGLVAYRKLVPQSDDVSHNDVAGPIVTTVGTMLAVIVSFMLVTVWQQYDQASSTVVQEASAVADLYHVATNFPEPVQSQLRAAINEYARIVVEDEWPAMRTGGESLAAGTASLHLLNVIARYEPKTNAQQALQQDAVSLVTTIVDARRDRLFDNAQGIPNILWAGMWLLTFVTIACSYVFRIRNEVMHAAMTIALGAVIGVTFVLIAEFDYPFRGDAQISAAPWTTLQATIAGTPMPIR